MPDSLRFSKLKLENWRQFSTVDLDLSSQLTVITGANATGKTSILNLLAAHFNWHYSFLAVPKRRSTGGITYLSDRRTEVELVDKRQKETIPDEIIGSLEYSNGQRADIGIGHYGGSVEYSVSRSNYVEVSGLFINSHRALSVYKAVENIPAKFSESDQILEQFLTEMRGRAGLDTYNRSGKNAVLLMKEALLSAAIYGEGNSSIEKDENARQVWEGFQGCLRLVFPESLGFERLIAIPPDILMVTKTGRFTIDAASGGISAILELTWQIFLRSRSETSFTVCFDEPENHLHPSLQRSILPSLTRAFPEIRFVVATHSPFVVASSPDANVYALDYGDTGVFSRKLDLINESAAAEDVLKQVLGLDTTLPIWAETRFETIVNRYLELGFPKPAELKNLRDELKRAGLYNQFPQAIDEISRYVSDENEGNA